MRRGSLFSSANRSALFVLSHERLVRAAAGEVRE